jgi:hypothetical protein
VPLLISPLLLPRRNALGQLVEAEKPMEIGKIVIGENRTFQHSSMLLQQKLIKIPASAVCGGLQLRALFKPTGVEDTQEEPIIIEKWCSKHHHAPWRKVLAPYGHRLYVLLYKGDRIFAPLLSAVETSS